jgi:hypothetical protein
MRRFMALQAPAAVPGGVSATKPRRGRRCERLCESRGRLSDMHIIIKRIGVLLEIESSALARVSWSNALILASSS